MRICHITSMHDAGDDRIFERACRGLVRAGYQVTLIATGDEEAVVAGVRVVPIRPRRGLARRVFSSREAYRRALSIDADVFHFHDPDLLPWMVRLRRKGRRVIYDVHENYVVRVDQRPVPGFLKGPARTLVRVLEEGAVARLDGVVTVSESLRRRFSRRARDCAVVRNVVDLDRLATVDVDLPKDPGPVILTSGSHSMHRNCMQTVEALAKVSGRWPSLRLRFLGSYYPESFREALERRAVALGVADRVELLGHVPWEENFSRIPVAFVGCVFFEENSSNRVALPNRLFEYMFCGIPVLAEGFPEIQRIVEETGCGLTVDSSSPDSIATAMESLLSDPARAAEMGRRGRKAVLERYNFGNELREMLSLYDRVCGSAR